VNLAVLSGGLDSTCALAVTKADVAVSFDYGQRHRRELDAAAAVAAHYRIPHTVVDLTSMFTGPSALLNPGTAMPEGRYDHPSMAATVVPGRNLLFAAAAIARTRSGDTVVVGVHAGDHPVYPDCRPEFWTALADLTAAAYGVTVAAPFLHSSKAEALTAGVAAAAPVDLTWSCYAGGEQHCGRCGTCVERQESFYLAGIPDPTEYVDSDYWRAVCGVSA
jgi:7-cyano-7-deazaguanine synthase